MVGRILEAIDENKTFVIITSDHGATPTENITHPEYVPFNVNNLLKEKELLVTKKDARIIGLCGERVGEIIEKQYS